jgi:DNA-binding response OmpR family regulator
MARVMIIDDEPDLTEICTLVLESEGHEVECWQPGDPVLASLMRFRPDVILLDWILGPMRGEQVLALIARDLRVVVMSALHGVEPIARSLGAVGFLPKPFTPEELSFAVENALYQQAEAPNL